MSGARELSGTCRPCATVYFWCSSDLNAPQLKDAACCKCGRRLERRNGRTKLRHSVEQRTPGWYPKPKLTLTEIDPSTIPY
jgi:hypothetical protein